MKPIFVVGAARSGTTLTGQIIGSLQNVFSPGESHFFEDIYTRRSQFGPLETPEELEVLLPHLMSLYGRYNFPETQILVEKIVDTELIRVNALKDGGGYQAVYHQFMSQLASSDHKTRYCDDTPKHLFHLDDILTLYPDAKIVACIRDPRDFMASYKNYWKRSTESQRVKALYHPILTSLLWRSSAQKIVESMSKHGPNTFHLLKYEDLVKDPNREIQRLCEFIGEPFEEKVLNVKVNNSSEVSQNESKRGIFSHSVGKWKDQLESDEIWWIQFINRAMMSHFNYQTASISFSPIPVGWQLINFPITLYKSMQANKDKRGPLLSYVFRRLRPLFQSKT